MLLLLEAIPLWIVLFILNMSVSEVPSAQKKKKIQTYLKMMYSGKGIQG